LDVTILTLAMLAQPELLVGRHEASRIAKVIATVARKHTLDPSLLAAIAIAESGGRNVVAHRRGRKRQGADVGVFQIHCPGARPACIARYRDLERSALAAAEILTEGRMLCERDRRIPPRRFCREGFWARYNPGSRRWIHRVRDLWWRIRSRVEGREPAKRPRKGSSPHPGWT
jgi:hypothetical protein